ncbi:MAG: hypothetical protein K0Q79_524 [Flavipsychrobacter sp.]|jgi:hypothetical protein|nr:hypothetical protein [Flavipsychrobacter sp.]
MIGPDNEIDILKHLQGSWQRADKKISFTIDKSRVNDIKSTVEITDTDFLLDFNVANLKWQLTAPVFGVGSAIINFEKKSFTILVRDGEAIMSPIII